MAVTPTKKIHRLFRKKEIQKSQETTKRKKVEKKTTKQDSENIDSDSYELHDLSNISECSIKAKKPKRYIKKVEKKKRGRKPAFSADDILEKLQDEDLFHEDGQLKKESDPIWKTVILKFGTQIGKHTLYLKVLDDDDLLQTKLRSAKFDHQPPSCEVDNESTSNECVAMKVETLHGLETVFNDVYYRLMLKELSSKPFHVFYSWPEQRSLYQDFYKKEDFPIILSSSQQVHPQIIGNKETEIINCVAVHSEINGHPISFCQSMMTRSDEDFIHYFLSEWLREKIPAPTHVICTLSDLNAVILAFNFMTVDEYCSKCFDNFENPKSDLPSSVIQIESVAFINNVKTVIDNCFDGDGYDEVRKFHLECIIHLASITDFMVFEWTMKKILTILKSDYINDEIRGFIMDLRRAGSDEKVQAWKSKCEAYNAEEKKGYTLHNLLNCNKQQNITNYLSKRYAESIKNCSRTGNEGNAYKNIDYLKFFIKLLHTLPVWTNLCVMKNYELSFEYEELSSNYWNSVKEYIAIKEKNTLIRSAEEYITYHADFLVEKIETCRQSLSNAKIVIRPDEIVKQSIDFYACLQSRENWMGKIETAAAVQYQNESVMSTDEYTDINDEDTIFGISPTQLINDISNIPTENKSIIKDANKSNPILVNDNESVLSSDFKHESESARIEFEHKYAQVPGSNKTLQTVKNINQNSIIHSTPLKTKDKSGKYTTAFPAIKAFYKKPSQRKVTKKIIQNKKPNKLKSKQYFYKNTSVFDSLCELIIQALFNFYQFKDFCADIAANLSELDFVKSLLTYAETGNLANLYKDRFIFLKEIGYVQGDVLYCCDKPSVYLAQFMTKYPSITELIKCTCGYSNVSYKYTLKTIPDAPVLQDCCNCGEVVIVSFQLGCYIAINKEEETEPIDIYAIKNSITVENKTYLLAGVIGYTKSNVKQNYVHYTAYCRKIGGAWIIKDSFKNKTEYLKKKQSTISIAIILYVHQDL